jgi:hypothetical protein
MGSRCANQRCHENESFREHAIEIVGSVDNLMQHVQPTEPFITLADQKRVPDPRHSPRPELGEFFADPVSGALGQRGPVRPREAHVRRAGVGSFSPQRAIELEALW